MRFAKPLQIDVEEHCFKIFFMLSPDWKPLPIFTSERLPLSDIRFIANHITDLMSVNLISC